jgi:hypothetical protein
LLVNPSSGERRLRFRNRIATAAVTVRTVQCRFLRARPSGIIQGKSIAAAASVQWEIQ